jgi:predicted alpha/beta-hydrolase family hydrolase
MVSENVRIDLESQDHVSAILTSLDRPSKMNRIGLIVAHGASNDMNNPLIVAVSEGLATAGYVTLRFNFPYKEKGKKSPDSQATLIHAWQCAHEHLKCNQKFPVERTIAVGKSMGGRVASQMVAERRMDVAGLIFLGYPLHAPGKKDQLRDAHLYRINLPMLFFAGTKDPLCDLGKLNTVLNNLRCPHDLEIIDGGNHSFKLPKSANRSEGDVHSQIQRKCLAWLQQFD